MPRVPRERQLGDALTFDIAVLPDIHFPFHDRPALGVTVDYLRSKRWDLVVQLGDLLDLDFFGRFVKGKPGLTEGRRARDDFDEAKAFVHELLAPAARAQNPACQLAFLQGNHETRLDKFLEEHSYLEGMLDIPKILDLDSLGATWVKSDADGDVLAACWSESSAHIAVRTLKPDAAPPRHLIGFIHGWYHGVHHAKQTMERFGHGPIYYGHVHDQQTCTIQRWGERSYRGGSVGHLGTSNPKYMHGRPNRWQHGFLELHLDPTTPGMYVDVLLQINQGRMVGPDGKVYQWQSK